MNRVLCKRFVSEQNSYIVICESHLLDKNLEENFYVDPKYFSGVETDLDEALVLAKDADYVTLLGNNVVERAISLGICSPESVRMIGAEMYAEVVKV